MEAIFRSLLSFVIDDNDDVDVDMMIIILLAKYKYVYRSIYFLIERGKKEKGETVIILVVRYR